MSHAPLEIPAGFAPPAAIFARAAAQLYPPARLDVHESALRYRVLHNPGGGVSGPWSDEKTPYLVRPMQCLSDRAYSIVALMGPGQSAKSALGENWIAHTVVVDNGNLIWLGPDKALLRDYVVTKVNPMIRRSPEVAARQLKTPSADNIFSKEFLGDMTISFVWPVAAQLRMRSAPRWVIDDYDAVPQDIDGEGHPITLLSTRQTAFERKAKGLAMSSPALGPERGIEALVAAGTDERWWWPCPHCGAWFRPEFARDLAFKRDGTPEQAGESAHVVCPAHGCVIDAGEKIGMLGNGRWAGPEQTVGAGGAASGPAKASATASFRIDGLMGLGSWAKLAREARAAEIAFERIQDESQLRAFFNTQVGVNYRSRLEGEAPVTAGELQARAEKRRLGIVPASVRFLTCAVDVQGNRFEVMVQGWGADAESWIVDRFAIRQLADARTDVAPGRQAAHWDALVARAVDASYPLEDDPGRALGIANVAIDSGGVPGVDEHARAFVRRLAAAGVPDWRLTLIKGAATKNAEALGHPTFEVDDKGRRRKDAVALYVIGVHRLKDVIEARLRAAAPGPGYLHFPADLEARHYDELRGETKEDGEWRRTGPNETWDLAVYNEVARRRLAADRPGLDWANPPDWARPRARLGAPISPVSPVPAANGVRAGRRVLSTGVG